MMAQVRESTVRSWQPIAASMNLPDSKFAPLVDLLSEESFSQEQRRFECQMDCLCSIEEWAGSQRESRRRKLEAFLGPEMLVRYDAYVEAIPERTDVQELQRRLPEGGRMSDDAVGRLALALSVERQRFIAGAGLGGRRIQISGNVVKEYEGEQAPARLGGPFNEALTDQFHRGQIDIAERMLDQQQMAEFRKFLQERVNGAKLMSGLIPR